MGSGSTGVACKKTHRNFIGIDKGICEREGEFFMKPWAEVAQYRIDQEEAFDIWLSADA